MIEKDQFTARMNRTEAKIAAQSSDENRQARLRSVRLHLIEISMRFHNKLSDADGTSKREIVRALVQRTEIGQTKVAVILRLPIDTSWRALNPMMVTLSGA